MSELSSIPPLWEWVTLGEISEIVTGNTPPTTDFGNYGGDIPFVKPPQLQDAVIVSAPESLSSFGAVKARLLPIGSVLVSCIGVLGKTAVARVRCATNQQINAVLFADPIDVMFGFYYAQTLRSWLEDNASATTVAIVNKRKFETAPFPLAPVNEQSRIVAKLEELLSDLDAGVAELKAAQAKLAQYRQSLLKAAVDGSLTAEWRKTHKPKESGAELLERILVERRRRWEKKQLAKFKEQGKTPPKGWENTYPQPVKPDTSTLPELPEGWVWASMQMVGDTQLGRQRSPQFHTGSNMVPYLRVANVFEDRIDVSDVMDMHFSKQDEETFLLSPGDILLNEGQSLELVGRSAIYRGELPKACFTNTLVRFRPYAGVSVEYAQSVFLSCLKNGRFRKIATITTNIAHLGAGRFSEIEFPLPSADEQEAILEILSDSLSSLEEQAAEIDRVLGQASAQRKNILKAAFSGQLVPQDPTDEPASALLERIRAERAAAGGKAATKRGRKAKT